MKSYKIRYQFIYNGELVVAGKSYNDAAKLGQEYFNGENAYDNIKSEMPNGFADLKFKVQSITPTKAKADLSPKPDKKADFINCFGINMSKEDKWF